MGYTIVSGNRPSSVALHQNHAKCIYRNAWIKCQIFVLNLNMSIYIDISRKTIFGFDCELIRRFWIYRYSLYEALWLLAQPLNYRKIIRRMKIYKIIWKISMFYHRCIYIVSNIVHSLCLKLTRLWRSITDYHCFYPHQEVIMCGLQVVAVFMA